jgi:hypothetical protein
MRYFKFNTLFLILSLSSVKSLSQDEGLKKLNARFDQYRRDTFLEKLYLHTDQNFYLTGELMWFRIYAVEGTFHRPSSLSKVAYVEVLDKNNRSVVQSKVQLGENGGEGSLFLPATIGSGNYILRAYTQWMRNFPPEFYFHRHVTIVNPFLRPEVEEERNHTGPAIEFFPEGGNLVAGIRTKVGFRISATDTAGLTASIVRNGQDTVAHLRPFRFGLGHFYLNAEAGSDYKCILRDKKGNVFIHPIPQLYAKGYSMHLTDSGTVVRVDVRKKSGTTGEWAYLFLHARQAVIAAEAKLFQSEKASFVIEKSKLPGGIAHFTVFNDELVPVCERLFFKTPEQHLQLSVNSQTSYTTRRKVELDVSAAIAGKPSAADASLAVYKLDSLSSHGNESILSYLYLSSDLKGDVTSPDYYFSDDSGVVQAADNLMLTHGWRRFNWDSILQNKREISYVPEFRSHLVTASVTRQDGTPVPGVLTYLSSPGKLVNLYGGRSGPDGKTYFEMRDFWGVRKLIVQTNTAVDSTYRLTVADPFDGRYRSHKIAPLRLSPDIRERLSARALAMQVHDVYYRTEVDKITMMKDDSTAFFGHSDEKYNLEDYTRFQVMEEVMREYVPGVLVRKRRDGFHFVVLDRLNKGVLPDDPLILIDGMPVFDADKVMAFDPLKIKKLEVVTRRFYAGPLVLNGIVSYSTYDGDLAGFEIDPKAVAIDYEGLQLQREFYAPKYENQKARSSRLPDQRTLLQWSPKLKLNSNGNAKVEFYTSDVEGDFIAVVEGISADGIPGSGFFKFSVKRADF